MLSFVFFFKQKTAYEMRISDWSSDVCSSDLSTFGAAVLDGEFAVTITAIAVPVSEFSGVALDLPGVAPGQWTAIRIPIRPGGATPSPRAGAYPEIGRASCRERVCQYV